MWILYQVLYGLVLVLAAPFLVARRGTHYLPTIPGRLTFQKGLPGPPPAPGAGRDPLWLHAVSVGETGVAATLVGALEATPDGAPPLLVTTITPTGQARARSLFDGRAAVAYLPFDLGFLVRRFLRRHRPAALVLVEGDYWPTLLRRARRDGLPVAVINGRVGDRSYARLGRLLRLPGGRHLLGAYFAPMTHFGVQSAEDRRRLVALGVPEERVTVTGNLKYESPAPPLLPALEERLSRLAAGRPVLVAGSTMQGEEELLLEAFAAAGGADAALLVLAPRHPERWDEVARLVERSGFDALRRSGLEVDGSATEASTGKGAGAESRPTVLLLDTLGELAAVYRRADAAFIGGTLVPTGGHNPLEAARFGVPTVVGPSMENFRDMAAAFDAAGAWRRAADAAELGRILHDWWQQPDAALAVGRRARALVDDNRGAVDRTLVMLQPLLAATERR